MSSKARRSPDEIRRDLDKIDAEIIKDLARRDGLVDEMTVAKKDSGMAAHQPERYQQMLEARQAQAVSLGVDPKLIRNVYDVIHEHSIRRQQQAGL